MMKFSLVLLLSLIRLQSSGASGSCACEAEELGFKIDCDDEATMLAAISELKTKGCATDCSSAECEKNYLIVQSHHDYCSKIPEEIEDGFHDYDDTCKPCDITRPTTQDAPDCPTPNCADKSGDESYGRLLDSGCQTNCASDLCKENYFMLVTVHDFCEHDTLSRVSEEGLHDMETPCEDLHKCNPPNGDKDQTVCDDHGDSHADHDSHDNESSAAGTATGAAAFLVGSIMMLV